MDKPRLLLASQSPRRRDLLHLLGLPFDVTVADVDEEPQPGESPASLVTRLSRVKAGGAELDGHRNRLVIACDTIVALEEASGGFAILGKPEDSDEAVAMLRRLRGRSHVVYSAVTVLDPNGAASTKLVETRLRMRAYDERELAGYVASGDPMDKAGAYAIQHEGFSPVEEIDGCYASVMGLPLCHLTQCLRRQGCHPAANVPAACQDYTDRCCTVYREIVGP